MHDDRLMILIYIARIEIHMEAVLHSMFLMWFLPCVLLNCELSEIMCVDCFYKSSNGVQNTAIRCLLYYKPPSSGLNEID